MLKNYMLLLSVTQNDATTTRAIHERITKNVDANAKPLWIDAKGIGIFISTGLPAIDIWTTAFTSQTDHARDALIIELGNDWLARRDAKTEHWLTTHIGNPKPSKNRRR